MMMYVIPIDLAKKTMQVLERKKKRIAFFGKRRFSHYLSLIRPILFCLALGLFFVSLHHYTFAPKLPVKRLFDFANVPIPYDYYKYCYNASSNSIIFIQLTNRSNEWNRLEACAFRRAAETNQRVGVCVLTPITMQTHRSLVHIPNLEFAPLNVDEILNGTPMYDWYENVPAGKYALYELSDAVRYAYLYKYGGYYLDTDVLSLRNFVRLRNVTAYEKEGSGFVAIGVMFFDRHHPLMASVMHEALRSYDPYLWGTFGPTLITGVIKRSIVPEATYRLLSKEFYPTNFDEREQPFDARTKKWTLDRTKNAYTLHLWRALFRDKPNDYWNDRVQLPNGSFVQELCGES